MRNNPYSSLSLIPKYLNDYKTAYNFCISCKLGYILGYKKFRLEYDKLRLEYAKKLGYEKCIEKGYVDLIKLLHENNLIPKKIAIIASLHFHLDILKYMHKHNIDIYRDLLCTHALYYDRLDIIKWCFENSDIEEICFVYSYFNNISMDIMIDISETYDENNSLKYLYDTLLKIENVLSIRENKNLINNFKYIVFLFACAKNQFNFIKYFAEENKNINFNMIILACRANSNINIIKWLYENTKENYENNAIICDYSMIDAACDNRVCQRSYNSNHTLEIVKWLHENVKQNCTTYAMDYACYDGKLEVVKFLHENRTEGCTTKAMNWASIRGHHDVIEYLKNYVFNK